MGLQWLTGAQVQPSLQTLLPSGPLPDHNLTVVVRVFDRSGGFSEASTVVRVEPSAAVNGAFIRDILASAEEEYDASRHWPRLLTTLISVAVEIDSTPSLSESLKRESLSLFLEIFFSALPASHTYYELATQFLSLLTTSTGNIDDIVVSLTTIGSWFKGQSSIEPAVILPVANSNQEEPLQLLAVESVAPPTSHLPLQTAAHLLATWSTISDSLSDDITSATALVTAVGDIAASLCQEVVYGEPPSLVMSSVIELTVIKTPPVGLFEIGGNVVEFRTSLEGVYYDQACPWEQQTCHETCFIGAQYLTDLFSSGHFLQLSTTAEEGIIAEIEGSDPQQTQLISSIVSVTVSIPARNGFLDVDELEQEIVVLLRLQAPLPSNDSIPLCLYRELGGRHGFSSPGWQLDSISPSLVVVNSVIYYQCSSSHLTEFAVGLLPPPVLPPPPSPTPSPSPLPSSTPSPPPSPSPSLAPPTSSGQTGISPAVFAVPVIVVIVIVTIAGLTVAVLLWRKKKIKKVKITPTDATSSSGVEGTDGGTKLVHSGPLTPEESKVPMPIIELLASGKREVVGSMSVLPSIRLRELRYHLLDHFASFKSKPFYFLTRQLVDIEPPTEQQQFVSLVYGEEADVPIFVRRVEAKSDLTRLHFCVCGNAAQFECSGCSAQGYCSPECQNSDWNDRHLRECARLGEKKQRMSVLRRQSTALSPVDEANRLPSIFPERQKISTATPLDFRSLLQSQRSFQQASFSSTQSLEPSVATPSITSPARPPPLPPLTAAPTSRAPTLPPLITPRSSRTTIGMLAAQSLPPTIREENEEEDGPVVAVHPASPTTPYFRPPPGRYNRTRLAPLLTSPALTPSSSTTTGGQPTLSPPHSTPITSPHPHSSPTSQFFHRPNRHLRVMMSEQQSTSTAVTVDPRKLSVQSLGPVDYSAPSPSPPPTAASRQSREVRTQPELESGSDTSSESEDEDEEEPTSPLPLSRPPSLSVRSKKLAAPPSPSPSSSSSSGSSEDSSSDTQPSTPLVT